MKPGMETNPQVRLGEPKHRWKLQKGMTTDEVREHLGEPIQIDDMGWASDVRWSYEDGYVLFTPQLGGGIGIHTFETKASPSDPD